jgi:polysaccharide export outer membrane protein
MKTMMQPFIAAVVAVVVMVAAGPGHCQLALESYCVSPGDVLDVTVYGEPTLSGQFRVGPGGTISMAVIGNVSVGGQPLGELETVIGTRLRAMIRRPMVTVALNEAASQRNVYVSGEVQQTGTVTLPFGATIADAVAAVGPTPGADLASVRVTSPASEPEIVDLSGLRSAAPISESRLVRHGDAIYVPRITQRIAVLGQVNTPGEMLLPLGERITVLEAIGRLGGGLTASADRSSALIIRAGEPNISIDLGRLLQDGDLTQNVRLEPGDVLVVREAGKISVLGEVRAPATFDVGEPITVLEALARAGSVTADAALDRAQVITPEGAIPIDLEGLLMRGEMQYNLSVRPGDVVLVPPAAPETVLILGAVARPGVINIREEQQRDLLRLLTVAGPTPMADLQHVHVYRDEGALTVNMRAVMEGDLGANVELEPDDVVVVPEVDTIYVMGAVTQQGPVPVTRDLTLLDVVARYGNFQTANMEEVTVIRTTETGETEFITRNMGEADEGVAPEDMPLQEGDIVFIPFRDRGFDWNELRSILWAVGAVWGLVGGLF